MALGDQGLTPLEHTDNYAVFANGGIEVHAYGIEEIHTLQGELLYSHQRDEPERKRLFDRKVIEELNTMLEGVVTHGTGRRAQLDFTYSVGKTGTSSNWRDGWFMGFTGEYVVGVWMGNDDFTPMARVTGGSFPAQAWHDFMVMAHDTDNIPEIPGLPLHPVQVAEQERLSQAAASRGHELRCGDSGGEPGKRQGYVERDAPDPGKDRRSAEGSAVPQPARRPRSGPGATRG